MNVLTLDSLPDRGGDSDQDGEDAFIDQLISLQQRIDGKYPELIIDRAALSSIPRSSVFVVFKSLTDPTTPRFYRCLLPGMSLIQCQNCELIMEEDEFEMVVLKTGACPFCRISIDPKTNLPAKKLAVNKP
uniref:Uncharacterized protein n=1 Tax=Spongospora subterranea TaxID=70186 RepID=A0A0H5QGE6_9EUKA|eukprot:CRZ00667.1 hypothetical protein [Spongospora subterranea]